MREIRLSGSEGGAGFIPCSYPYPESRATLGISIGVRGDSHLPGLEEKCRPSKIVCNTSFEIRLHGVTGRTTPFVTVNRTRMNRNWRNRIVWMAADKNHSPWSLDLQSDELPALHEKQTHRAQPGRWHGLLVPRCRRGCRRSEPVERSSNKNGAISHREGEAPAEPQHVFL